MTPKPTKKMCHAWSDAYASSFCVREKGHKWMHRDPWGREWKQERTPIKRKKVKP